MTRDEFVEMVMLSPEVAKNQQDEPTKLKLCGLYIDSVVTAVGMSHNWDFVMDVADEDLTASQSLYILKGNDNNCRRIKSIRWGDSGAADTAMVPVTRKNHVDLDHWLERNSPSECQIWIRRRSVQNSPRIQLLDTPSTSGKIIRYRYWVKNIQFDDFPVGDFDLVFLLGVQRLFDTKSLELKKAYEDELRNAIDRIQPFSGEPMTSMQDPQVVLENRYRYGQAGY